MDKHVQDILSQDEIDALVDGVESGDVPTESKTGGSGEAKLCDLTSKDKMIRNRLSSLDIVNQKYTRLLQMTVFSLLQRNADITTGKVEILKFSDYLQRLYVPTSVNIVRLHPLRGVGMVVFDAPLVFGLVDLFFGGDGRQVNIEGREFTVIESRIVDKVLTRTLSDIKESWQGVADLDLELIGSEMNPMMAAVHSSDETLVVSSFQLQLDSVQGDINIALPYAMLEPVLDALDAGVTRDEEQGESWVNTLLQHFNNVNVDLTCAMAEAQLTIRDIKSLKVGDVIPVTMSDPAILCANEMPVYKARIGSSNGKVALRILQSIGQD